MCLGAGSEGEPLLCLARCREITAAESRQTSGVGNASGFRNLLATAGAQGSDSGAVSQSCALAAARERDLLAASGHADPETEKAMKPRPTLAKVALVAGVSKSSAANVLSGRRKMSEDTTRRVLAAAKSLGYRSDTAASSLSRGRTQVIGVLVAEFVPGLVVSGISAVFVKRCSEAGIVVTFAGQDRVQSLIDSGIDMLIVLGAPDADGYSELRMPFGLPVVGLEMADSGQFGWGGHDTGEIADAVVSHLTEQGARHIGWMVGPAARETFKPWALSLEEAARAAGLAFSAASHDGSGKSIAQAFKKLLGGGVDAVFSVGVDTSPIFDALASIGKSAPSDVLVVVQAEGIIEQAMTPKVSTLSLMAHETGTIIADMCIAIVTGGEVATLELPFELTVRESSVRS